VSLFHFLYFSLVSRVNWLRAKARVDRWIEEEQLVKHEMEWTTIWFRRQVESWRERSERNNPKLPLGHKSYAAKQHKLWNAFERKSSERFKLYM
jgi:hypothetical protein